MGFADLNEFSEVENIDFGGCYATWLKTGICAVTNMDIEILLHIHIFISMRASFL